MRNYSESDINEFLNNFDYDVRKSGDARWIDQKCTSDVVSLVADCIIQFIRFDISKEFTASAIQYSNYAVENVQQIFAKPDPSKKALNEYDKYFGQPLKLLAYSKVLNSEVRSGRNYYTINNMKLLEFISIRERNAFVFLCCYIEKVLNDSGIYYLFENFFKEQNQNSFLDCKEGFSSFTIKFTPINTKVECNRIFIKVLNPLACKYKKLGTVRGRISKDIITFDMIMYNQRNWRDIYSEKPKGMTREEYGYIIVNREDRMATYTINKAKKFIRDYNDKYRGGISEVEDKNQMEDLASQIHHIFPVSLYPEIADYYENLIALTPNQHYLYAHPLNNTNYVDRVYQYFCLIAKAGTIKENIINDNLPTIYTFEDFTYVLNVGLETEEFDNVSNMDFSSVVRKLDLFYDAK